MNDPSWEDDTNDDDRQRPLEVIIAVVLGLAAMGCVFVVWQMIAGAQLG